MKVSILTQPLGRNYGGLLQAYALQVCLRRLGCAVETLDRRKSSSIVSKAEELSRRLIKLFLYKAGVLSENRLDDFIVQNLMAFKKNSISMSPSISSERALRRYYQSNSFDVVLVGSDQVWRPKYSPSLHNFFFNFIDDIRSSAKRVAYGASFGVDEWEFSNKDTAVCKRLVGKFNAVSVREQSGVELCKRHFDITPEWVLDPTMLLDKSDYDSLAPDIECDGLEGGVLTYLLDPSPEKIAVVEKASRVLGKNAKYLISEKTQYPEIAEWLRSFRTSRFVVTDSFHGCVFAIIYNKPFVTVGNSERGLARFESLLKLFGLEHRLVRAGKEVDISLLDDDVDWNAVNRIRRDRAAAGRMFLEKAIFHDLENRSR